MGLKYKFQLYCDLLFKLWVTVNPFQKQDYLFLLRYRLFREMILLESKGITHKDLENQGTENFNQVAKTHLTDSVKKGDKDRVIKVMVILWIINLLRIYLTASKINKLYVTNKPQENVPIYFKNCGWKKNKAPKITLNGIKKNNAEKISALLYPIIGYPGFISHQENYQLSTKISKGKTKTEYKLLTMLESNLVTLLIFFF